MKKMIAVWLVMILMGGLIGFVNLSTAAEESGNGDAETRSAAHGTISINGNGVFASQASSEGWAGDGSEGNPYIIENYDVNASEATDDDAAGIKIENTDVYFIIRNCVIHDGYEWGVSYNDGICFYNAKNGKIENCEIYNNDDGISFSSFSNNNAITSNQIHNNNRDGIRHGSSLNNNITNCNVYNNSLGIYLLSSSNYNITGNQIYNNSGDWYYSGGIYLSTSSNNLITANQIYNNSDNGIYLYSSYSPYSSDNEIHYNNIYNNTNYGISSSYTVNAIYNWWSSADGPSGVGPGTGDAVSSNVLFEPWLTEPWGGGVPYFYITVTANPTTISSGETSTITITVTDGTNPVSGATINLQSDNGSSFSSVTDSGTGTYTVTFTAPTVSVQTVCRIPVEATKTGYTSGSHHVDVTVTPDVLGNHAPVISSINANPTTVSTGGQVTITVGATDADAGDVLSYVYSCTGGTISGTGSTITWIASSTAGDYTITVYVNDGTVNSNSKSVSVTVTSPEKEEPKGFIPGFEATILITMIGACTILLRRRKH